MSLTTFGDLLSEADAVLTDLAARRSLDAAGMVAGWQQLSRRAVHAITAATGDRDPRWYAVDRLAIQVARPMPVGLRGKAAAAVDPQPALARAAYLLGAACGMGMWPWWLPTVDQHGIPDHLAQPAIPPNQSEAVLCRGRRWSRCGVARPAEPCGWNIPPRGTCRD